MRISDWSSDVCSSDLLERARALSTAPARETVVLVGHGAGDDSADAHWNALLQSLARQIRALGGNDFRAIHTGTWREDWPDRRAASVARIRAGVSAATAAGGTAVLIPARRTGRGRTEGRRVGKESVSI